MVNSKTEVLLDLQKGARRLGSGSSVVPATPPSNAGRADPPKLPAIPPILLLFGVTHRLGR